MFSRASGLKADEVGAQTQKCLQETQPPGGIACGRRCQGTDGGACAKKLRRWYRRQPRFVRGRAGDTAESGILPPRIPGRGPHPWDDSTRYRRTGLARLRRIFLSAPLNDLSVSRLRLSAPPAAARPGWRSFAGRGSGSGRRSPRLRAAHVSPTRAPPVRPAGVIVRPHNPSGRARTPSPRIRSGRPASCRGR
jgi:hypothetical protein